MKTTKGHSVAGLQTAYHPKENVYRGWSGRLRVVEGNPFYDDYLKWNSDGTAFKHKYGDLVFKESK